jgi:HSP90 family molecular chaperone
MLNVAHPLIQDLAGLQSDDQNLVRTLRLLYSHAALLEQHNTSRDTLLQLFEESSAALEHFIEQEESKSGG